VLTVLKQNIMDHYISTGTCSTLMAVSHKQNAQDFVNNRSTYLGSYRRSIKRCIKFRIFLHFYTLLKPDQKAVFCCIIFIKPVQVISVNTYIYLKIRVFLLKSSPGQILTLKYTGNICSLQ
jgi:hypothetical protein